MIIHCAPCRARWSMSDPRAGFDPSHVVRCPRCSKHLSTMGELSTAPYVEVEGPDAKGRYPVLESLSIGRDPIKPLQLLAGEVSRNHARIERTSKGVYIIDQSSMNGTSVNGHQIRSEWPHPLGRGDVIEIGEFRMKFQTPSSLPQRRKGKKFPAPPAEPLQISSPHFSVPGRLKKVRELEPVAPEKPTRAPEVIAEFEAGSLTLGEVPVTDDTAFSDSFKKELGSAPDGDLLQEYRKLRMAFGVSQELREVPDVPELLHRALGIVLEVFPAKRGAIFLMEDSKRSLKIVRSRDSIEDSEHRFSETLLDRVQEERKALLTLDAMEDVGSESIVAAGVHSAMSVPLVSKDELIGILHLDDARKDQGAFTREDLEILTGIGAMIAVALEGVELQEKARQDEAAKIGLSRYLSPKLVDQVLGEKIRIEPGGELRDATIMFCDIRGFSELTEGMPPIAVTALLNEFFELMVDIIFSYDGTLDKFIGDGLMAVWGLPLAAREDPVDAVRAALQMQAEIELFNQRRCSVGDPPVHVGIGINSGTVLAGNIGSSKRMEYTVIGDAVNLASRICDVAGKGEILITSRTHGGLGEIIQVHQLPPVALKGFKDPVEILRVQGLFEDQQGADRRRSRRLKVAIGAHWRRQGENEGRSGIIENISAIGCALQVPVTDPESFAMEDVLLLEFDLPGGKRVKDLQGRIRAVEFRCNSSSMVFCDLKLEFTGVRAEIQRHLGRLEG